MGQILKFPVQASKLGYKRVRRRVRFADDPDQLNLFPQAVAQILNFSAVGSCFEQALLLDECEDLKAAELYRKAIEAQDRVADAYCNLGIIESRRGDTTKAFDCFTTSLKHDPRHSEAHYNLGNLYFDLNDFRLAQIHYEMAAELEACFANVYFNLALVLAINHDFSAASSALRKYQELVPEDEARKAGELLGDLKESLAAAGPSRVGSTLR